ncbi:uncharacterized protein [Rutidosis leptorrhynchoides]|uniref:uncharacterized protein n=1 Tax=Rutidosis leptorrhynchoides TaxID=125765 RepID=UPI003A99FAC7
MDPANSAEKGDIRLKISKFGRRIETNGSSTTTIFEPQSSLETRDSSNVNSVISPRSPEVKAPEKKLTLFALRLAIFEKAATGLGTLGFIWATVVLLGGFAIVLDKTDFWFVTIILLIEGTRIFSRSHELEWQHQATWSITDAGISSFRVLRSSSNFLMHSLKAMFRPVLSSRSSQSSKEASRSSPSRNSRILTRGRKVPTRTWEAPDVPLLPQWVFLARNISKILYWLQLASATACVVLSLMKLIKHNYGEIEKGDTDRRNRKSALNIFYALALAEASLFLLEKAYWEYKVIFRKILEQVNNECELGPSGMLTIRRFFYDAYSKCVDGSIFDGLKMDMVSFSMDLLDSNSSDEQLIGIRVLRQFSISERFSDDTLQKIGINLSVIERFVEMLNWKDPQDEEIRRSAAEILSKLAAKKQNSLRVAGIPGAMESISSLLQTNRKFSSAADEIGEKKIVLDEQHYGFWTFNNLGLLLLKKLARDHDNCGKIGNTRGLLPKIIDFTHAEENLLNNEHVAQSQILTIKRSLQLLRMLSSTTGPTGKHLRQEISEIVFTISNIRDVLQCGEKHPTLQKLGIQILTSLALEEEATERIGGTGGILKALFHIYFKQGVPEDQNHVKVAAGEALATLALESKSNCHRILRLNVLGKLLGALEDPVLRVNAARILRNLCIYGVEDSYHLLKEVTSAAPTVLKSIMMTEESKLQEVMIGLAASIFKFMTSQESRSMFQSARIKQVELATALVQILGRHKFLPVKVPRIRRFCIELAIWMMRDDANNIFIFKDLGMEKDLEHVLETTAELESFNIFSGTVGVSRHSVTMHCLIETALVLLMDG